MSTGQILAFLVENLSIMGIVISNVLCKVFYSTDFYAYLYLPAKNRMYIFLQFMQWFQSSKIQHRLKLSKKFFGLIWKLIHNSDNYTQVWISFCFVLFCLSS